MAIQSREDSTMPETYKAKMYVRGREREVTVVKCDCGEKICCPEFTQTCSCGADYNMSGQRLAPKTKKGPSWRAKQRIIAQPAPSDQ